MSDIYPIPIGKLFGQLTKQYIGIVTKQLESMDMERYFYAVYVIGNVSASLTQNALAEQLHVDKATMVRIVDYLSDRNYIYREQNAADRRQYFLRLTEKGVAALPKITKAFATADAHCLAALDETNKSDFVKSLQRVVGHLSSVDADMVKIDFKKIKS